MLDFIRKLRVRIQKNDKRVDAIDILCGELKTALDAEAVYISNGSIKIDPKSGDDASYGREETALIELSALILALIQDFINRENAEIDGRRSAAIRSALSALSYSELEAAVHIVNEVKGEGIMIASKLAEKSGVTRSVMVNAVRKLESAGLVESRSMGVKGTHVKILDDLLIKEMGKLYK